MALTAQEWLRRIGGLSPSVPEDDPAREAARRLQALTPPEDAPKPGPSGVDWENDREALGAELRRLREASRPLVVKLPPEAPPAPEPKPLGYVAVIRRNGVLLPVGSVTPYGERAQRDADWWSANDEAGAFVAELREVTP
jgi:hypothetical protein